MDEARLECSECHLKYDKGKRCPRSLFCGHTFCTHCLEQVIARGTRRCPTCSRPFIALSAAQLPTDFNLLKAATSSTPRTPAFRTSDSTSSHEWRSGTSALPSSTLQTSSSRGGPTSPSSYTQGLRSTASTTTTRGLDLPAIGRNVRTSSHSGSGLPLGSAASTRSLSSDSGSKLRLSDDPKGLSSPDNSWSKDDVDAPRSATYSRFNSEELRESRPQSTLSYELPTISNPFSVSNRGSNVSQSSSETNGTVGLRDEGLSSTSHLLSNGSTEISTETRRSRTSHRFNTSSDESLNTTASTSRESESKHVQTRPISSVQLPLTNRVSRLLSQDQRSTDSSSSEHDSSSKSTRVSDPVVSTASNAAFPKLSKFDSTLRSSASGTSSDTKAEVDEVDRSISSRERDENLVWRRNTTADARKSRMRDSNTPSHVLKMCRSITTKSRNLSSNEDDSRTASAAPSSSETDTKTREKSFARGLSHESPGFGDDISPTPLRSREDPGSSRGLLGNLSPSSSYRSDDGQPDGEYNEATSDSENRDPNLSRPQAVSKFNSPLTRMRENVATQRRTSVPSGSANETTHQERVKDSSSAKWKMTESFDKENVDITPSQHQTGRMFRTFDKTRRLDRSLSASLKDLSGSTRESEGRRRSVSPDTVLTRSRSTELENVRESQSGVSSSTSREAGRLARSSTLSARLSARTGFISKTITEENEENLKGNRSPAEENYHGSGKVSNTFDQETRSAQRSSLSARLMSRTSYLSRTSSAGVDAVTPRRLREDQGDAPAGEQSSPDPGARLTSSSLSRMRRTRSEDHPPTSSWSDDSVHSVARRVEKITQTESHKTRETSSVDPGGTDEAADSSNTAPSLPLSPPPTTSNSIFPDLRQQGDGNERRDEDVSEDQTDEDESSATDGEFWDSTQGDKLGTNKASSGVADPSTDGELKSGKVEPKSLSQRGRWRRYRSVDSGSEDETRIAKTSHKTSKYQGEVTSHEKPSALASDGPSSASSWRSGSTSSRSSYHSPLGGKSLRTANSKTSLGSYGDHIARAKGTEGDSATRPSLSLPTDTTAGDTTPAEGISASSGEGKRLHRPLSSTGESPRFRAWMGRSSRTVQDSSKDLDDGSTSPASKTSWLRSTKSLPLISSDSGRGQRGEDKGGHDLRLTSSWCSATDESPRRGKLSDPGEDRSQSEDGSEDNDTDDSENTLNSWRGFDSHLESQEYRRTTSEHQRTYQGPESNSNLHRGPPAAEGDDTNTQHVKSAKNGASDEQNKDSKSTRDEGVEDPHTGGAANTSRPRLTTNDLRLKSSDDFDVPRTHTAPVGKNLEAKLSRPGTSSSVQDIWRARNAKNRNFLAARARQTHNTANEAQGKADISDSGVQQRQSRYQMRDALSTDTEQGRSQPNSLSLRLSFLRSNLQHKTEEEEKEEEEEEVKQVEDQSSERVSTFANRQQKLTQSRQSQFDGESGGELARARSVDSQEFSLPPSTSTGTGDIDDAKRVKANPSNADQKQQSPSDQTEAQTLAEDDMEMSEDTNQRITSLHSSDLGRDDVDGPHLWKVPGTSKPRLARPAVPETDSNASQTRPMTQFHLEQDSSLTSNGVKASLKGKIRTSPSVTSSGFQPVDKAEPALASCTPEAPPGVGSCSNHGLLLHLYCKRCEEWVCDSCLDILHPPPPDGRCQVISATEAVVHMKMTHSEFLNSRVNALDHFREELSKLLMECDCSIAEHDANINQLRVRLEEEKGLLGGIEAMRSLVLQKMNQIDYWEDVLQRNATRINRSSSSQEIMSAVQVNRSNILANIMGGMALPEATLNQR
ncbi:uncharacterized protein [Panulirus ornatus]|uniref:uncharacterized protein n=1 Tax=Panulirus ornatus TaxID=150431 RepID=UPI003A8612BE